MILVVVDDLEGGAVPDVMDLGAVRFDDRDFYAGDPWGAYEQLRREAPVFWYEPGGFWLISKYEDVKRISSDPGLFSSKRGVVLGDLHPELGLSAEELQRCRAEGMSAAEIRGVAASARHWQGGEEFLPSDPPRHTQLRKIVSRAFTPRVVSNLVPRIEQLAKETLDRFVPGDVVEFIEDVALPVPMYIIAELLGMPKERWADFRRWSDAAIQLSDEKDPEAIAQIKQVRLGMVEFFGEMLDERRRNPGEDLMSLLLAAEVEGEHLSGPTLLMFCTTLLSAGNETTRNLIAAGAKALWEHPDQRAILIERPELIDTAVDELLRWVTPVISFGRTAMQDVELRGQQIAEGDYVHMLYPSANRDEDVWDRADQLDVTRPIDPRHVAFGFGEHACLGASLARHEARVVFRDLLARFPDYELAGEVDRLRSTNINGIVRMSVRL